MSARDGSNHVHGRAVKVVRQPRRVEEMDAGAWRAVKEHSKSERQERHGSWKQDNVKHIGEAGLRYTWANDGLAMLLRETGKPAVDFFPTTGRWRVVGKNAQTMGGHAEKFLKWYAGATA